MPFFDRPRRHQNRHFSLTSIRFRYAGKPEVRLERNLEMKSGFCSIAQEKRLGRRREFGTSARR
jgi:hypothetical protein